jgi:hypothetical protein
MENLKIIKYRNNMIWVNYTKKEMLTKISLSFRDNRNYNFTIKTKVFPRDM